MLSYIRLTDNNVSFRLISHISNLVPVGITGSKTGFSFVSTLKMFISSTRKKLTPNPTKTSKCIFFGRLGSYILVLKSTKYPFAGCDYSALGIPKDTPEMPATLGDTCVVISSSGLCKAVC